ncbi:phospholipase D-like domain-containing protein DpdK [Sorangium sp. So ce134]
MTSRYISKSNWQCRHEARDLLQAIFGSELVVPSRCLWIVSPWISDIPVLENDALSFRFPNVGWGRRQVRLSEAIVELVRRSTTVILATRPDNHNRIFLQQLEQACADAGYASRLRVHFAEALHEKGIVGDGFYLGGSMNMTHNGLEILEEALHFTIDPEVVAQTRVRYFERWGGSR